MGNAESGNPVRNMDKRTARREYKSDFAAAIVKYRQRSGHSLPSQSSPGAGGDINWENSGNVKVFVRKRPIFQHEIDNSEFDVATCFPNRVIIHDARMHNDMKRQLMNHHEFTFDRVFHEKTSNDVVYVQTARPLVSIAVNGGYSTALVYGQTGSGKTFTMTSIYTHAARDIFKMLDEQVARFATPPVVSLSFFEIAGDQVCDLLNGFRPAQLTTGSDGSVHAYPVVEPVVSNADDLLAIIQHGLSIRTTAATGVHDTSSRSHAVLRIYVQRYDVDSNGIEGTLTLVDLAGSEHRIDSMYHGKERRKETSYINASLMALKDCIRGRAAQFAQAAATNQPVNLTANAHIYRKSKLTMALKNSFVLPAARTIVIATVSPASKDTEHSLNTLRHACLMNGQPGDGSSPAGGKDVETRFITGGTVTTEQIGEINISSIARKNLALKKQQGSLSESKTSNGNTLDNRVAKAANQEVELTDKMKQKMRRMSENKSFVNLPPKIKEIFKAYRQQLGNETRQIMRLRGANSRLMEGDFPIAEVDDNLLEPGCDEEEDDDDNLDVQDDVQQGFHSSLKDEEIAEELDLPARQPNKGNHNSTKSAAAKAMLTNQYEDDFEDDTAPPLSARSHNKQQRSSTPTQRLRPPSGKSPKNHTTNDQLPAETSIHTTIPRISFHRIYEAIYIAQDEVPERILLKQLRAMLRNHGYTDREIHALIDTHQTQPEDSGTTTSAPPSKRQTSTGSAGGASSGSRSSTPLSARTAQSVQPATPTASSRRPVSASRTRSTHSSSNNNVLRDSMDTADSSANNYHNNTKATAYRAVAGGGIVKSALVVPAKKRSSTPTNGNTTTTTNSSSSGGNGKVSKQTVFDEDAPILTSKQKLRQQQAAFEEQEHQQALSLAKQQVEREAEQKRARQEAARAFREEQERSKAEKVKGKISRPQRLQQEQAEMELSSANDVERQGHIDEIARLTLLLEEDAQLPIQSEARLSSAKKFGVKKQLSVHKAAILRLERAKLALAQPSSSTSNVSSAVGAGHIRATNALSSGPEPALNVDQILQQQQEQERKERLARMNAKKKTQSQNVHRPFEYNPDDFHVEDQPSLSHEDAVYPPIDPSDAAAAGEYVVSATGRPLSQRMQHHLAQKQSHQSPTPGTSARDQSRGTSMTEGYGHGGGGGSVVGYHIDQRTSYDGHPQHSGAQHQPVTMRTSSSDYYQQQAHPRDNHYGSDPRYAAQTRYDDDYSANPSSVSYHGGTGPAGGGASYGGRQVISYAEFFQEGREEIGGAGAHGGGRVSQNQQYNNSSHHYQERPRSGSRR